MKEINLVEILKDCPKGTKLYSCIHGEVEFCRIVPNTWYPIVVTNRLGGDVTFTSNGQYCFTTGECLLFPSVNNRDWSTFVAPKKKIGRFDPKTLKPFDKVLGRDGHGSRWVAAFFSHINHGFCLPYRVTPGCGFAQVIPYKDNEHLVGKVGEPYEYFRYWEDADGQTTGT